MLDELLRITAGIDSLSKTLQRENKALQQQLKQRALVSHEPEGGDEGEDEDESEMS